MKLKYREKPEHICKEYVSQKEEPFKIYQIEENEISIRSRNESFVRSEAVSPMEGPYTKDVTFIPSQDPHEDIDAAYDTFRVERKTSKDDEISRHGKMYHEFPDVSEYLDDREYVKPQKEEVKEVKKEENISFDFGIKTLNRKEVKEEIKQKTEEKPVTYEELKLYEEKIKKQVPKKEREEVTTIITYGARKQEEIQSEPIQEKVPIAEPSFNYSEEQIMYDAPIDDEIIPTRESEEFGFESFKEEDIPVREEEIQEYPINEPRHEEPKEESRVVMVDKYLDYQYPPLSLLDPVKESSLEIPDWLEEKRDVIDKTLKEFNVDAQVVNYTYGPSVTRYEVKMASGVMVKKITQIQDELMMNLCAKQIRIETPIPGKSNVGIEVPNNEQRAVQFSELATNDLFTKATKPLTICVGLNIDKEPVFVDIAKMPHGLVAGKTGSGKSVFMNALIISLILRNSPDDLRMIMVDPKQVEFAAYREIPHLVTPVITDPKIANEALKWACSEMDRRFRAFPAMRVKDIVGFNERAKEAGVKKLPYLVIIIDELADLMMTCGGDVVDSIRRITQLGRAAGIHMIIATQRPTTDVVNGGVKANVPTRIAFGVSQTIDSVTILDQGGAEALLGRGDMLYKNDLGINRLQGAYVNDEEIQRIVDFIGSKYGPDYIFTHDSLIEKQKQQYGASNEEEMEVLYNVAIDVIDKATCSINNIQKTFGFGFNRAQRIVEILEEMGIVSEKKGTTGREILKTREQVEDLFKGE